LRTCGNSSIIIAFKLIIFLNLPLGQPQVGVVIRFPAQVKQFDAELEHVAH
jgi:hypothetical protein